jgi:hypothetical protein
MHLQRSATGAGPFSIPFGRSFAGERLAHPSRLPAPQGALRRRGLCCEHRRARRWLLECRTEPCLENVDVGKEHGRRSAVERVFWSQPHFLGEEDGARPQLEVHVGHRTAVPGDTRHERGHGAGLFARPARIEEVDGRLEDSGREAGQH